MPLPVWRKSKTLATMLAPVKFFSVCSESMPLKFRRISETLSAQLALMGICSHPFKMNILFLDWWITRFSCFMHFYFMPLTIAPVVKSLVTMWTIIRLFCGVCYSMTLKLAPEIKSLVTMWTIKRLFCGVCYSMTLKIYSGREALSTLCTFIWCLRHVCFFVHWCTRPVR